MVGLLERIALGFLRKSVSGAVAMGDRTCKDLVLYYDDPAAVPADLDCPLYRIGDRDRVTDAPGGKLAVISVTHDSAGLDDLIALYSQKGQYILHYPSPLLIRLSGTICKGEGALTRPRRHARTARFRSNRGLACLESDTVDVYRPVSPALVTSVLCLILALSFFSGLTLPLDDLARHCKAFLYNYDYRNLFVYSYHPAYDPYIGFDVIAGFLYRLFGRISYLLLQLAPLMLTAAAIGRIMKGSAANMISLAILITFYYTSAAFVSGRPCVLISSLFLCAYAMRDDLPGAVHFLLGLFMAALYYLFFLYAVPLIASGIRRRKTDYLAATISAAVVWQIYSGGQYIHSIMRLATSIHLGRAVAYAELQPIFFGGMLAFLPALLPMFLYVRRDIKAALTACYFMLSNQVRFFATITPLTSTFIRHLPLRVNALVVIAALSLSLMHVHMYRHVTLAMPAGSTVLAENSPAMNSVVMDSPGRVEVAPSANLGWNDKTVRTALQRMQTDGTIDCSVFTTHKFDYVVEHCLKTVPACLSLDRVEGPYRIWKVRQN